MDAWIHPSHSWPKPNSSESGAAIQNIPFDGPGVIRVVISSHSEVARHYHITLFVCLRSRRRWSCFLNGKNIKQGDILLSSQEFMDLKRAQRFDIVSC